MSLQAQQMEFNKNVVKQIRKQKLQNEMIRPTQPLEFRHPLMGPILLPGNSPAYSNIIQRFPSGAGLERMIGGKKPNKILRLIEGASKAALPLALGAVGTYMGGPAGGLGGVALGRAVSDEIPQGGKINKASRVVERIGLKLGKIGESLSEKVASKMFDSGVKSITDSSVTGGARYKKGDKTAPVPKEFSEWRLFFMNFRKENKELTFRESQKRASEKWKKEKKIKTTKKTKEKEEMPEMEGSARPKGAKDKKKRDVKPWISFVKAYAKEKEVTYKEALSLAGPAYREEKAKIGFPKPK